MRVQADPLRVRVVCADVLARGGLSTLLQRLGAVVVDDGATVAVWDLGAVGDPPPIRMSADEPVLALYGKTAAARRALARGASGALPRDTDPERLLAALQALATDLVVLDDNVAAELLPASEDDPVEPLTRREQEVLALMAEGLSNRNIGEALDISEHTVRFHVRSVLGKLGARNRAEAVARAARSGLLAV